MGDMVMDVQEAARTAIWARDTLAKLCATRSEEMVGRAAYRHMELRFARALIRILPRVLGEAEIVLWSGEMHDMAVRGAIEAFDGLPVSQSVLNMRQPQFWYNPDFNFGIEAGGDLDIPEGSACDMALLFPAPPEGEPRALCGVLFYGDEGAILPLVRSCSSLIPGRGLAGADLFFIALHEFMKLKLAAKSPVHLPRPDRRRLQREGKEPPEINVIHLRRRESSEWHSPSGREYHHQWIVKGHWRRLHKARKKDGAAVTYVESYVKGPEGAPLLKPRETVFKVVR